MRLLTLLTITAMLSGCAGPAAARLKDYKDQYQACIAANLGDDSKCVTEKKVYDAELKYYNSGSSKSAARPTTCVTTSSGRVTNCL